MTITKIGNELLDIFFEYVSEIGMSDFTHLPRLVDPSNIHPSDLRLQVLEEIHGIGLTGDDNGKDSDTRAGSANQDESGDGGCSVGDVRSRERFDKGDSGDNTLGVRSNRDGSIADSGTGIAGEGAGDTEGGGVDASDGRDTDVAAGVPVGVDGDLPVQGVEGRETTVGRLDRLGVIRRCACGCGEVIRKGGTRRRYLNKNHANRAYRARKVKTRRVKNRGKDSYRSEKTFYLYREAGEAIMGWMQGRDWTIKTEIEAWGGLDEWIFDKSKSVKTTDPRFSNLMKALVGAGYLELREDWIKKAHQGGYIKYKVRKWRAT